MGLHEHQAAPLGQVPFGEALGFWFKLGFISFGGPAGQIALMHRTLVEDKRWISEARFLHALNYCMLLPGPEAQQLATYLGWLMHRSWGGVLAGLLFVLPSLAILMGLSWVYVAFGTLPWVAGLLYGIKPAVAAIVLQAVHRMGSRTLKKPAQAPVLWAVAAMSFVAVAWLNVSFPWVVLVAALTGWLAQRRDMDQFSKTPSHGGTAQASIAPEQAHTAYLIDDHCPTPEHARFKPWRLARVLLAGAALWLLPMVLLVAWQGWSGTLAQMGWFFSKAALLTFGGAYAVLPYVYQGGVEHFGWLSGPQMMDGLALGETTLGPLIMVVAFVGFLGGWSQQVLGPQALLAGALLAATVVTWFTFLPSFIFILAGGPLVESTHGKQHFTAPLTAITASVVGVMASLALFFLVHVAQGSGAKSLWGVMVDLPALTLAALAALALLRYKLGMLRVMAACAVAGLALKLTGCC
ncbi:chromate efflux transporter [Rhodoferax sp. U11-2br]|uniref:chromate efflux transporter n=1 Tax=Rhodoferax sp. U11-2br TaxID=2838878 RepID=UPI001BE5C850|nr:chromate efflux transporter [Rhodoferax sp. U11-2br]MBT3066395.1 chromate efflux transporter [Rhodoferax sp. U11-2br]